MSTMSDSMPNASSTGVGEPSPATVMSSASVSCRCVGYRPRILDEVGIDLEAEVDAIAEREQRDVQPHLVEQDAGREDAGEPRAAHVERHRRARHVGDDRVHHAGHIREHVRLVREPQQRPQHERRRGVADRADRVRPHDLVHLLGRGRVPHDGPQPLPRDRRCPSRSEPRGTTTGCRARRHPRLGSTPGCRR